MTAERRGNIGVEVDAEGEIVLAPYETIEEAWESLQRSASQIRRQELEDDLQERIDPWEALKARKDDSSGCLGLFSVIAISLFASRH